MIAEALAQMRALSHCRWLHVHVGFALVLYTKRGIAATSEVLAKLTCRPGSGAYGLAHKLSLLCMMVAHLKMSCI